MTDPHLRILAAAARHSQRQLDAHDLDSEPVDAGAVQRRRDLSERLRRASSRLAAVRARRRLTPQRPNGPKARGRGESGPDDDRHVL